jgi:ribose/xylose/arabinose/galactoside ABC-type transport system permease subunit
MSDVKTQGAKSRVVLFLSGKLVWIILVLLLIFSFSASPYFRNHINLTNVLKQSIGLGIAALGQTFVIISGGIHSCSALDLPAGCSTHLSSSN